MTLRTRTLILLVAGIGGAGCGSAPEEAAPETSAAGTGEVPAFLPPRGAEGDAPDPYAMSAEALERELGLTRAGRVVLEALRAHGGWGAWRDVTGLVVRFERSVPAAPPAVPVARLGVPGHFVAAFSREPGRGGWLAAVEEEGLSDGPPAPPEKAELGGPVFILAAPFSFIDRRLKAEELGIEVDAASGKTFAKVRFSPARTFPPFPAIAYFDTTTEMLSRLLVSSGEGEFTLIVYSDWVLPEGSDLRLSSERAGYFLESRFQHVDLEAPDWRERVFEVDLRSSPG